MAQVVHMALMAAVAAVPVAALAQDALPESWLTSMPAEELTANLLIARKIEARCRNVRLRATAEEIIRERGAELAGYLYERKFGPSAASRPAVDAFEKKHQTSYDGVNSLCRAGYLEMKEGSPIGRLLQAK